MRKIDSKDTTSYLLTKSLSGGKVQHFVRQFSTWCFFEGRAHINTETASPMMAASVQALSENFFVN